MQTEEVVPRAQSTGLDGSLSEHTAPFHQPLRFTQHIQYPLPSFSSMAVKQEPQDEDDRGRQPNALSPQTEIEDAQSSPIGSLNHKRAPEQSSPEHGSLNLQAPQQNGCKKPASRGRRKSRWKLKFHHQALPPEYLDHYEAALAQEAALNSSTTIGTESRIASPAPMTPMPAFTPTPGPMVDVQSWLQRLTAMQNEIYPNPLQPPQLTATNLCQTTASRRSVITSTQSTQSIHSPHTTFINQQQHPNHSNNHQIRHSVQIQPSPRPPMKYSDLPYMGEITLDNSKPRRGRKPKKADICHLIYKNYGTILPGTPGLDDKSKLSSIREKLDPKDTPLPIPFQRTDIQNRISSLLEKRLTQERRALEISVDGTKEQEEPLNLCIRDLNLLKIRLHENHSSFGSYHSKSEGSSDAEDIEYLGVACQNLPETKHLIKSNNDVNNIDPKCIEVENRALINNNNNQIHNCNNNNNSSSNNNNNTNNNNSNSNSNSNNNNNNNNNSNNSNNNNENNGNGNDFINNNNDSRSKDNPGFLYWPNAGVFIHPVALQSQFLYYQKLAQEKGLSSPEQIPGPKEQRIVPKSVYPVVENTKPPVIAPAVAPPAETPPAPIEAPVVSTPSPRPKRNSTSQGQASNQPIKRKRSAIFIPPMPTENNNNPATEVSICKFKFTGGAKPTLQEKKSLSVDSGGNFRYYSGTGDKSMRGYEFFPREALQQPANQAGGSSAGAFLTAAAERIPQATCPRPCSIQDDSRRKRKTRKSIQREKLEQTFKEKGFLIQTQQLESAEGATYCKFRQLRKFTRYLFRSWKDYLPGNVRELTDSGEPVASLKDVEHDGESLALSPLPPGNIELQQGLIENSPPSLSLN